MGNPNEVTPSRRSWEHLDLCIREAQKKDFDLLHQDHLADMFLIAEGYVGPAAALKYRDFLAHYDRQVKVEDVLQGRKKNVISTLDINESMNLIEKIANSDLLNQEDYSATDLEVQNITWFLGQCPAELMMKAFEHISSRNPTLIEQIWSTPVKDYDNFGAYIKVVLAGDKED